MTAEPGATRKVDLLVRNAYVVTMDPERRVYPGGAVAIDGGAIVSVGPERDVAAGLDTARTIDAHGAVVHPGFVDTHIHVSYHNFRWAIPEGVDYWEEYLGFHADYWEQVEDEEEHVGTLLASLEMARNGTTCFLEAGSTMAPDAGAAAIEKIGIRGVIADPHLMDVFGGRVVNRYPDEPRRAFRVMGTELKRNSDPDALVRGAHLPARAGDGVGRAPAGGEGAGRRARRRSEPTPVLGQAGRGRRRPAQGPPSAPPLRRDRRPRAELHLRPHELPAR